MRVRVVHVVSVLTFPYDTEPVPEATSIIFRGGEGQDIRKCVAAEVCSTTS